MSHLFGPYTLKAPHTKNTKNKFTKGHTIAFVTKDVTCHTSTEVFIILSMYSHYWHHLGPREIVIHIADPVSGPVSLKQNVTVTKGKGTWKILLLLTSDRFQDWEQFWTAGESKADKFSCQIFFYFCFCLFFFAKSPTICNSFFFIF